MGKKLSFVKCVYLKCKTILVTLFQYVFLCSVFSSVNIAAEWAFCDQDRLRHCLASHLTAASMAPWDPLSAASLSCPSGPGALASWLLSEYSRYTSSWGPLYLPCPLCRRVSSRKTAGLAHSLPSAHMSPSQRIFPDRPVDKNWHPLSGFVFFPNKIHTC